MEQCQEVWRDCGFAAGTKLVGTEKCDVGLAGRSASGGLEVRPHSYHFGLDLDSRLVGTRWCEWALGLSA